MVTQKEECARKARKRGQFVTQKEGVYPMLRKNRVVCPVERC